jgi:hypothetical protein
MQGVVSEIATQRLGGTFATPKNPSLNSFWRNLEKPLHKSERRVRI